MRTERKGWTTGVFAILLGSAGVLSLPTTASAATAVDIDNVGPTPLLIEGQAVYGWEFSTFQSIQITAWGLYDQGSNGLNIPDGFKGPHIIGLWSGTGDLLATGTIPAGDQTTLEGYFRYVPTTGIVLPGGTYVIGSWADHVYGEDLMRSVRSATFDPSINYLHTRYGRGGAGIELPFPDETQDFARPGYFGPNFKFEVVPEPSTVALLIMGSIICIWVARRKRLSSRVCSDG